METSEPVKQSPLNRATRFTERLVNRVSFWFAAVFLLFLAGNSLLRTSYFDIFETDEVVHYKWDFPLWSLLFAAGVVLLAVLALHYQLYEKALGRHLDIALLIYLLALSTIWVFSAQAVPIDEPGSIHDTAVAHLRGDYSSLLEGGYNHLFPFQLGFTLYIETVYRIFGEGNFYAVQLLNVCFIALAAFSLVRATRHLFKDARITFLCTALLFGCLYTIPYTTFNYAIIPAMGVGMCALWALAAWLDKRRWPSLVAAVLLSALAYILKSNYIIFSIGLAIVLLCDAAKHRKLASAVAAPILIIATLLAQQLVYTVYEARSGYEIGEGVPMSVWVAMGLKDNSSMGPGWWNGDTYSVYPENNYDTELTKAVSRQSIRESLSGFAQDPAYGFSFFYYKLMSEWNEPTFGSFSAAWPATQNGNPGGPLTPLFGASAWSSLITRYMDCYHLLIMAAAAACFLLRRKSITTAQLLPAIILLGGMLCHLFWEAKSQYLMQYSLLLIPYAAAGLCALAAKAQGLVGMLQKREPRRPLKRDSNAPLPQAAKQTP